MIVASQELEKYNPEVSSYLWTDELGRLRVWTANMGAHQVGQKSLDYRLREASHLKDQTLRVLRRLERTIEDLQTLLDDTDTHDDISSASESEEEDHTEIQQIYCSLQDTVNILFKTSMSIRRPAQHDRLIGVKRSDATSFEPFDRQHVANKFPLVPDPLIDRLGLAISQRRATLRYRERHHLKLAQGLDRIMDNGEDGISIILSETVATEFPQQAADDTFEIQSSVSQTSFAATIMDGGKGIAVPPPPKDLSQCDSFECPYCFLIINVKNKSSWVKHVFHDLMPYICVFPSCRWPRRLYESRREWYAHLQIEHSLPGSGDVSMECPLCHLSISSGKSFERHVGRHLQELALFALPKVGSEKEGESYTSTVSEGDVQHSDFEKLNILHVPGGDGEDDNSNPYTSIISGAERSEREMIYQPNILSGTEFDYQPEQSQVVPRDFELHVGTFMSSVSMDPDSASLEPSGPETHISESLETKTQKFVHPVQKQGLHDDGERQTEGKGKNKAENEPPETLLVDVGQWVEQNNKAEHNSEGKYSEIEIQFDHHPLGEDVSANRKRKVERSHSRNGNTRIPRRLVHIDAVLKMGYSFRETKGSEFSQYYKGETVVIGKVLSKEQIDKLIDLSRHYNRVTNASIDGIPRRRTRSNGKLVIVEVGGGASEDERNTTSRHYPTAPFPSKPRRRAGSNDGIRDVEEIRRLRLERLEGRR
ncbi:hypothetical protein N7540_004689 [Penicillium herquei]|nr:hypothetical protein N7540_004689 [Penicillium herquei]